MGLNVPVQEETKRCLNVSKLFAQASYAAGEGCAKPPSISFLQDLQEVYENIADYYEDDFEIGEDSRFKTLALLYDTLYRLKKLAPQDFQSVYNSHLETNNYETWIRAWELTYPTFVNRHIKQGGISKKHLHLLFLLKAALEGWERDVDWDHWENQFYDAISQAADTYSRNHLAVTLFDTRASIFMGGVTPQKIEV